MPILLRVFRLDKINVNTYRSCNMSLHLAFDVGHSSIGWSVLLASSPSSPALLGTGVVTFEADNCLASKRRAYRRQRRHVRATRQRIARLEKLLAHLEVLSATDLEAKHRQAGGHSAPWFLAARVLADNGAAQHLLTWVELWDVLRWYAHNRGYDGNRRWSSAEQADSDEAQDDTEKAQNALALMAEYNTPTMAETMVRVLGLDVAGDKRASRVRFKAKNAAFPREIVEQEVVRILEAHRGHLRGIDNDFISLLTTRTLSKDQRDQLAAIGIRLPARYQGGLLFGQLVPRFDNRIIATCPISGEKVPTRNCPDFLRYRWAMQLAAVRVAESEAAELRPPRPDELRTLDNRMRAEGRLTKLEFKKAVRTLPGIVRDNLDTLLMHPDAEEALLLDPVTQLVRSDRLKNFWPILSPRAQKRARDAWTRGKTLTLSNLRALAEKYGEDTAAAAFDSAIINRLDAANTRKRKKDGGLTRESLLAEAFSVKKLSGRAAYARPLLQRAAEEVFAGKHPKEEGGCLYLDEAKRRAQLNRRIEEQTNNHLVRHRLLILERLLRDIVNDPAFANGDRTRVSRITIEVNRDLREMSGKTAKQIEQDLGLRLSNHDKVSKKLEAAFEEQTFSGRPIQITAGLIRKARIAEDLGWECPYTGSKFEPIDLVSRRVDKDHIIPRSQRPSDSLDSLVITYSEINKWKGNRTAWEFVRDEQGKPVPGLPHLSIRPLNEYNEWVEALEAFKGHDDDKRRKKNRKALLLLPRYEEKNKSFLPADLTQTSQLVRLGAQLITRFFADLPAPPQIVSLPGSVTAVVRRSWNLLGCLSLAAPQILDPNDPHRTKTKTEMRDITHLHHALDACVLAYASLLLPRDGGLWELMLKRNPNESDRARLAATGCFDFDSQGRFGLRDLPKDWKHQISQRLAEKRVVQHVPADMSGLRVEENTRGVEKVNNGRVHLRQQSRDPKTDAITIKRTNETLEKVVGLQPKDGNGKLKEVRGVRVITDNFGIAILDHASEGTEKFAIIPWHKVWHRIKELTQRNGGQPPRLLRPGMLFKVPRGRYQKSVWSLRGVAINQKAGHVVEIAESDVVNSREPRKPYCKQNVSLNTLIKDGLETIKTTLVGVPLTAINTTD